MSPKAPHLRPVIPCTSVRFSARRPPSFVAGRRRLRSAAVAAAAVAAIVALVAATMLLTGFDPTGGTHAGHPTTDGVLVLLLVAGMYAGAALVAGPVPVEG